ncbi:MAG TPA: 50S ribosomal protein L6 [Methanospirillum sp.]|nr:50S ribosomal protein L6 [Methanospirillum sp.]
MTAERTVSIPAGVTITLDGSIMKVKGPKGELVRDMWHPGITIVIDGDIVTFTTQSGKKKVVSMVGTLAAHCKNMGIGVLTGYKYDLKVVYNHFPIQLKLQGEKLEILNFLGEKYPRSARIIPGTTVKLGTDEVTVTGIDKELVGASAANIERATKIRFRDPRVFQDGIYIVARGEQ